jgi:ubiquinone biosynthesis accessory factor UbiJ
MFKPLAAEFLQHITNQNNWSRQHLHDFAGKVVQFNIAFIKTNLLILEDGSLSLATHNATADATIYIPPSLALRLVAKDEAAKMLIKIEGDTHLASELGKILQHMRWDMTEDLSKVVGDIPAEKIAAIGKKTMAVTKKQAINIAEMLTEFWQEEKPVLAKKWQVEQFNTDVDTLRSDFTRLEKKLVKLKQSIQESTTN